MRITATQKKVSFTSTPLYPVKIRRVLEHGVSVPIDAVLTKLNPNSPQDKKAVKTILQNWRSKTALINEFSDFFVEAAHKIPKESEFFALELESDGKKQIAGVSKLYYHANATAYTPLDLSHLISNPEFDANNSRRTIKGIGEVLFSVAFQRAKELKTPSLGFFSTNNRFYYHTLRKAKINLSDPGNPIITKKQQFKLPQNLFAKYIEYCEKKYGFKFPSL